MIADKDDILHKINEGVAILRMLTIILVITFAFSVYGGYTRDRVVLIAGGISFVLLGFMYVVVSKKLLMLDKEFSK